MEIINAHAQIYPDKIAEKATVTIGKFYDIEIINKAGFTLTKLKMMTLSR